jgi:hypothetical protein
MTGPWLAAFIILWVLVLLLAALVLGVLRRVLPLLDHLEQAQSRTAGEFGLPVGSALPAFEARDREGDAVTADGIPRPGVVLFLDPECRPCQKLATELRSDGPNLDSVPLVLVAPDTDAGRDLVPPNSPVLLQSGHAISRAFQTSITPHAFLVDADGRLSDQAIPESIADLNLLAAKLARKGVLVTSANPAQSVERR